jgi:plasmid stabilization system protein ParE
MDDIIKSAREIAAEKVAGLGEATEEERLEWKYIPEGERLATRYLTEDTNLAAELGKYDQGVRKYVARGVANVLVRSISLPDSDLAKRNNKRAMDGLKLVKTNQVALENTYSQMRRIFDHYLGQGAEQRRQAYEALKTEFETQVQQALQQQLGVMGRLRIDVEKQPQFQTEWRRRQNQMDAQYLRFLNELKQELAAVA